MYTEQKEELQDLIRKPTESEWLELKSWIDLAEPLARANTARHLAALTNYGGGYLIFGFNKDGTRCSKKDDVLKAYSHDSIGGIIDRYLKPIFQCDVHFEEFEGVKHPIIWIPSHSASPIFSKADGPQNEKGQVQGIRSGQIYIRIPKPASVAASTPEHLEKLIQRCAIARRDEMIGMFTAILSSTSSSTTAPTEKNHSKKLQEWHEATEHAFLVEIEEKKPQTNPPLKDNYIQFSYTLLGIEGQQIPEDKLLEVIGRTSAAVRDTVRYGWSMFFPFTRTEIAPHFMVDEKLDDGQTEFLQASLIGHSVHADFWRVSTDGRVSLARNFHEDRFENRPHNIAPEQKWFDPWLHIRDITELVRHARAMSEEFKNVSQICFEIEWQGLKSRVIASLNSERGTIGRGQSSVDARKIENCFSQAEVIGNLPFVVSKLYAPLHRMFDSNLNVSSEFIAALLPEFIMQGL